MSWRRLARRYVPYALRWRARLALRVADDARSGLRIAKTRAAPEVYPHLVCRYERPLICYEGQEASFPNKRNNVELALAGIDGLLIEPSETFSFWRCVGRPARARGYRLAAAIRDAVLTQDVGGAICLVSTLLYNVGLLGGLTIVERRCHSVDSYGERRYFELGRDAAVEHPYLDLRFRNDLGTPLLLRAHPEAERVVAEAWSAAPLGLCVQIDVDVDASDGLLRARTRRAVRRDGHRREEDLGWSTHLVPDSRHFGLLDTMEGRAETTPKRTHGDDET